MKLITVDFETFWDANHTLSKMSPIAYVMDSKTQLISMGIKIGDGETQVVFGEHKIREVIDSIDWSNAYVIGHNMSGFDSMILAWRLGVKPKLWGCTLAMARPIHAKTIGNSLEKLVQHYGIGVKDKTALVNTKGKRLEDFTADEIEAMAKYNAADVDQCYQLFTKLRPFYTAKELWLIDATIRMLVEPKFVIDRNLLESALAEERENKRKAIMAVADHLQRMGLATDEMVLCTTEEELEEAVRKALASANKFAVLLESLGVEVPMKPSPTNPDKLVPALAKTDEEFQKLKEHDNPVVAAAVRARLAVRSTILETRIETFIEASSAVGGKLPVPLHYCGADTTGRWSGWAYNCFLGDTEVLTEQGWVRFDAWKGEPIAQWWPDGSITMEYNPGVLVKPYAGPVVDIESRCVSSTMTPDHRLVSCPPTKSGIKERTAGWVAEHSGLDNIPAAGIWVGVSDSVMTPELVRLAVAFSADGCVVGDTIQVGLRRERKITRMRELLEAAGVPYRIREYPPQEGHKGAHNTVIFVIKNPPVGKGFGPWILRLSREALDALVSELVHWDGQPHYKSGRLCFWTTQRNDAEWVQTALALSGVISTIREYPSRNPAHKPKLLVYARKEPYTSIDTARDVTVREYEGLVYCASVESSYILIRRNSKISVVGQCQNLPRITPGKPKPSDALRKSMRAPEGYKVIVADQSGIELRVNHFLWKVPSSMALYKKDRKADLYKAFAAARYGISPEEVTKEQRQLAKLSQLGLGFGCGWKKFKLIAKTMGGLDLSDAEAEAVTTDWRNNYPEIVRGWRVCHEALQWVHDGVERPIDPWGLCWTSKYGIRLPSGRFIRYPGLHLEKTSDGDYEWWYGHGRHRTRIYAGKVTENCLAEGTLVLTDIGWKPIEEVTKDDLVHDGIEFVKHDGVVCNSVQKCIELDGVWLTPDHKVLTDEGWKEASQLVQTDNPTVTEKPVYDIVNCGPRHRFVVKGKNGPFIVHNCVQAIARDIIADNMFSFYKETGLYPALMVHDELVYVVPENQAEKLLDKLQQIMRTPPQWWPGIVLESEGDIADTYGDAK